MRCYKNVMQRYENVIFYLYVCIIKLFIIKSTIMIKLLLVEDNLEFASLLQEDLQNIWEGYKVKIALNGREGLEIWNKFHPDIIVSDVDMPVMTGLQMVREIRKVDQDIPILFTSILVSPNDVINGYDMGGDNYIKKPFTSGELNAHVKAILKMKANAGHKKEKELYPLGIYNFDWENGLLYNRMTNETKRLQRKKSEVLQLLVERKNEIVSREEFYHRIWKDSFSIRSLDVAICELRKLLEKDKCIKIESYPTLGYQLVMDY